VLQPCPLDKPTQGDHALDRRAMQFATPQAPDRLIDRTVIGVHCFVAAGTAAGLPAGCAPSEESSWLSPECGDQRRELRRYVRVVEMGRCLKGQDGHAYVA
jgi:hypothetical protein